MNACARCELHVSALLDGEATPAEILSVLDHLPTCEACESFLAASRGLQDAVASLRAAAPSAGIAPTRQVASKLRALSPRWVPALAAGIVFALGLLAGGSHWLSRRARPQPTSAMTEESFVEFARVLLDSEPRYRQSMLSLLLQVQSGETSSDAEERADVPPPAPPGDTSLDFASTDVPAGVLPR